MPEGDNFDKKKQTDKNKKPDMHQFVAQDNGEVKYTPFTRAVNVVFDNALWWTCLVLRIPEVFCGPLNCIKIFGDVN